MKTKIIFGLFSVIIFVLSKTAQEITLTTSKDNLTASKATIDMAGLAGNPQAIIFAAPIGDTAKLNPHPIGGVVLQRKSDSF